jgi:hypothetical protein
MSSRRSYFNANYTPRSWALILFFLVVIAIGLSTYVLVEGEIHEHDHHHHHHHNNTTNNSCQNCVLPSIVIGNTETTTCDNSATVVNTGNATDLILEFSIPRGCDGINGTNGVDGRNGTNGVDGINGTNGVDGLNGTNGVDGRNGTDGINGTNGIDGLNGTCDDNCSTITVSNLTLRYYSSINITASRSNSTFVPLHTLSIAANGTYYFVFEGTARKPSGSGNLQIQITSPAGIVKDESYRVIGKFEDSPDFTVVTSAIFLVNTAPTNVYLEWACSSSSTTHTMNRNSFRAISVGQGSIF